MVQFQSPYPSHLAGCPWGVHYQLPTGTTWPKEAKEKRIPEAVARGNPLVAQQLFPFPDKGRWGGAGPGLHIVLNHLWVSTACPRNSLSNPSLEVVLS